MKLLSTITEDIKILETHGNVDVYISSLSINSQDLVENSLFVAISGSVIDGHIFIKDAIKKGAKVIVYEKDLASIEHGVTYIKVEDTKEALGIISSNFYNHPSRKLKLVGITGTNGKTTTATLLHQLFRNLGHKVGMIGTVVNKINDKSYEADRTTPDSITLNKLLDMMVEEGCEYCFMEVSSHAVALRRIAGIFFTGGVFTNLTLDHLDYHKTFDEYRDAKKRFFDSLHEVAFSLSNIDDPNGSHMLKDTKAKKYFYSLKQNSDFTDKLKTKLIGEFNLYNTLAVYATAVLLGEDRENTKELIKSLEPVEGRFNYIKGKNGVMGIVDYAHTPDALENVLRAVIEMRGTSLPAVKNRRIISVFGCGGDRDTGKRPIMARIGYEMSDIIILTSDNPRTEDPEKVLRDMQAGIASLDQSKVEIIEDRAQAIEKAVSISKTGDYILIAGKGHEKYQEVNGVKKHFDDMEELRKYLSI